MRRLPPFPALRAFESAARHLSFKRAAEELCVTPSAISHQVKLLEGWVGTALFERDVRRIELTAKGEDLYLSTSKCLDELAIAFKVAERRRGRGDAGRLRICGDPGFIDCWLANRLPGFMALAPDRPVELHWGSSVEDYRKFRADVVLHFGRADQLPYEPIGQWRNNEFAVCSPLLLKAGPIRKVSDLRRFTILHERTPEAWIHWLSWAGLEGLDWAEEGPVYHGSSACLGAALAGQGVALADELVSADLLMSGQLVKPLGLVRESDYALTLLCRPGARNDAAVMAFITWLRAAIDSHRHAVHALIRQTPYSANAAQRQNSSR